MRCGMFWAVHSPRTLSRSLVRKSSESSSSVPSSSSIRLKKRVGGSWRSSPTTTTCLARAIAPNASTGRTWLASSINRRSNSISPGCKYWAIEIGLIMKTGLMAWIALPASFSNLRNGKCRRFFCISLRSIPTSPPPA